MAKATYRHDNHDFSFDDSDVCNPDDWIPAGEYNPHNVRPFLLHDHGFTVCVVFASNLQDALDTAVDENKMDRYLIGEAERGDYDYNPETGEYGEGVSYLGNAGEPFDIETLGVVELPNPSRSFAAQFASAFPPVAGSSGQTPGTSFYPSV
jgi:hypothetical protein